MEKQNMLEQIVKWGQEKSGRGRSSDAGQMVVRSKRLKTAKRMAPTISDKRLTTQEVAERLNVHAWTIYNWARIGRLPCIRLSKRTLRFLESDIVKYEKQHTSSPIR